MIEIKLDNNEFLRQFEVKKNGTLARIEYAEQERKIFLTKIVIPRSIYSKEFEEYFIKKTLEFISNKNGFIEGYTENYIKVREYWNPNKINTVQKRVLKSIDKMGYCRI